MKIEDLHEQMCIALEGAGAIRLDDELDPEKKRADLYFGEANALVEVKCLSTDRGELQSFQDRVDNAYRKSAIAPGVRHEDGRITFDIADLEPELGEPLIQFLGSRVRREIVHANAQIRSTAEQLDLRDFIGICIFVIPSHFATHNGVVATNAQRQIAGGSCSAIDGIVVVGVPVEEGALTGHVEAHLSFHARTGEDRIPRDLKERIAKTWVAHYAHQTRSETSIVEASAEEFERRFLNKKDGRR